MFARLRPGPQRGPAEQRSPGAVGGRGRRRPALVWAGVAVVVASSAAFTTLFAHVGRKIPVLAVARPVPAGAVVTAGDLREVRLGAGDVAGHVVPAADQDAVVGKAAVVPLVAGELLAPQEVGSRAAYPPAGKAQVSFAVDAGGVPAGLAAGQRVAVLPGAPAATAGEQTGDQAQGSPGTPLVGTVTDVTTGDQNSAPSVVTVLVDTAAASRAATIDKPHLVVLSPTSREVP
jgi:hypothetical protein